MYCIKNIRHITKHTVLKTLTVYIINHVICLVMSASQYKTQTDQVLYCLFCGNDCPAVHYTSNYGFLIRGKNDILGKIKKIFEIFI